MTDLAKLYRSRFPEQERARKDAIWQVLCAAFFQRYVKPDKDRVLEIAPGLGEFSRHIRAKEKFAIDLNPDSASFLPEEVQFRVGSADHMEAFPDCHFDVCFSSNFLEHLPTKSVLEVVLREVLRVLAPGGIYVCLQPNIRFCFDRYWDFIDHHIPLSDRSCAEAFDNAGFEVSELIPRFLPFTTKSSLPTDPRLVALYLKFPLAWRLVGEQFLIVGRKA